MVIAVAQEDTDIESHAKMVKNFKPAPLFQIAADVDRRKTPGYDRTTAYLIDKNGIVQEVFPMLIHVRPSWDAILERVDGIN